MISAWFRVVLVLLVLLGATAGVAGVSIAQVSEVKGTVQRVDTATGMVYFTDGRTMRLDPNTRIYVGNREVRLSDIEPGWILVTSGPSVTPGSVLVQSATPAPALVQPTGIDATGIVASVDARTGTVTLQDGRVVRVTPGTTVWQPVTIGSVMPGASVFVRNAEPLDFRPTASPTATPTAAPVVSRPYQMGTVSTSDPTRPQIVLSDGTIVQLRPGGTVSLNGQPVALTDLRTGDEIIIGLPAGSTAVTGQGASALPRSALGIVQADSINIVRRSPTPQSR